MENTKICPHCGCLLNIRERVCGNCGWQQPIQKGVPVPPPVSGSVHGAGYIPPSQQPKPQQPPQKESMVQKLLFVVLIVILLLCLLIVIGVIAIWNNYFVDGDPTDKKQSITTAQQTEIISLNPVAGAEAGSVIFGFSVKGYDPEKWILSYSAENEPERSVTFSGHTTTVSGLTVGKTYMFTLDAVSDVYIVGQNSIQFRVGDLIYPQNLAVTGIGEDGLHVTWETPANTTVDHWTVHCHNDTGFNQNMTRKENTATFENLDPTDSYTIEVIASGMSVGSRFYVSKNAVTVGAINAVPNGFYMDVTWEFTGPAPVSGWILVYSIDDGTAEYVVSGDGTTARIENLVPNSQYTVKLQLADGTTVLNDTVTVKIPEAETFADYTVSAADMKLAMCLIPEVAEWTYINVTTYKDSFVVGEKAGFVMRIYHKYYTSSDIITTLFVIRNSDGDIVKIGSSSQSWTSMWFNSYGELTIPEMPTEAGEYTIEIYFNSAFVHKQSFSVTEPEVAP